PYTPIYAPIPVGPDHDPIVYVPNAYGELTPMLRSQIPQTIPMAPVRDLAPRSVIDPRAQLLAGGGIAAAGLGWGASELLSAAAGAGAGTIAFLAAVVLAVRMAPSALRASVGTSQGGAAPASSTTTYITNTTTNVTNTNRWLGRSTTQVSNK
ncbi:hypothetical protein LCE31_34950, partial [Streptomyces sp. 8L]|nr:hypothetical protein [Streptomyces sp. 8L]